MITKVRYIIDFYDKRELKSRSTQFEKYLYAIEYYHDKLSDPNIKTAILRIETTTVETVTLCTYRRNNK